VPDPLPSVSVKNYNTIGIIKAPKIGSQESPIKTNAGNILTENMRQKLRGQ
jgi:hypothetical protein